MTAAVAPRDALLEAAEAPIPPHGVVPVTAVSVTALKVGIAALLAGVTACARCGGDRLRRCKADGRYAVVICDDCGYLHVRDQRDVTRAVRAVVDPNELRTAVRP